MTATTTSVRRPPSSGVRLIWIVPVLAALAIVVLLVSLSTSTPDRRTVSVDNRTDAVVTVRATGRDGGGWLGLGTVDPSTTSRFHSVFDQGGVWRFRLSVGPVGLGEIRRSSDQLAADDWHLTIPAATADRLRADRRAG